MNGGAAGRDRRKLGAALLALLLALLALLAWRVDPWLRAQARVRLEALLHGLLQGEVHIDRVARLSGGGILAEGVTVLDSARRPVLHAERLSLGLNLRALFGGTLHFSHGLLSDVRIHAIEAPSGAITLFEALSPRPDPQAGASSSWLSVLFDHIHVERARVYGGVPGLANFSASGVSARGQIRVDGGALHVAVSQARAKLTAPYPEPITLEHANLSLHSGAQLRVAARLRISQRDDRVRARLHYRAPPKGDDKLALTLALEPVSSELLLNLGVTAAQVLVPKVRGRVQLYGPTRELHYAAALDSAAGQLRVSGRLPEQGGVELQLGSDALNIAELIAYAPPISLALQVNAEAGRGEPVRIRADAPWLEVFGHRAQAAYVSGFYEGERFYFQDGRVKYAGGYFDLSGWVDNDADLYVRVRANVPDVARDPSVRRSGLSAGLRCDVHVARAAHALSFEGELSAEHVHYQALDAERISLRGEISFRDDLTEPALHLNGSGSGIALSGYQLGTLDFQLHGGRGNYQSEVAALAPDGRRAAVSLALERRGERYRIRAPDFELSVPGRDAWRARADITLSPDGVDIDQLELFSGAQQLKLSGSFSFTKAYRVDASLRQFDLGGLRALIGVDLADLDGSVDGDLKLFGVPDHPRIEAQGGVRHGQFLGMTGLSLDLKLIFADGRFDLDTTLVLPDKSRIALFVGGEPGAGDTWLEQIGSGNYQFGLNFEHVPFAVSRPWLAWLGIEPPAGNISAVLRGAGTFADPELDVSTRIEGIALGAYPPLDVELELAHDGAQLSLRKLRIVDQYGELVHALGSVRARLPELLDVGALRASLSQRPFELSLETPRRRLDELPGPLRSPWPIPAVLKARLAQSATGPTFEADALLGFPSEGSGVAGCDGSLRRPELAFHLQSAAGDKGRGTLALALDGAELGSAQLDVDLPLTGWLSGAQPLALPRTAFELALATSAAEDLPVLCEYIAGPLRVSASAQDAFALPPRLHVALRSQALQLSPSERQRQRLGNLRNVRTMGQAFALEAHLDVEDARVAFQALIEEVNAAGSASQVRGGKGSLLLSGSLPDAVFQPPERRDPAAAAPLELELRAHEFEISPLSIALPLPVRTAGKLEGVARLRYDLGPRKVALSGDLSFSQGTAGIAPLGQQLSDIGAHVTLHDDLLHIERLSLRDFDGTAKLTGDLRLLSLSELHAELSIALANFALRSEGVQVSRLTGKLALRAEVDPEQTRAELSVAELSVNLPSDLGLGLQDLDPHPGVEVVGEARPPPPADPYLFELRVLAQKPFRVLRSDLSAQVLADVTLRYLNPNLTLQGHVELKRGYFELYGRRFELQESRIAFDGDDQLDPLVSLYATYPVGEDEIGVRVEGRLSSPKVSFTHSNPAITDTSTIIGELLGVRNNDPARQTADASGAAAGILAGATAGLLTEQVRREFGGALPVLAMDSQGNSLRGARIRAGVQLDQLIEQRLGPLRKVVRGAYVEGFVAPGASSTNTVNPNAPPQSRGGGLLELRFPADLVGTVEYRPLQNWRVDMAWEP